MASTVPTRPSWTPEQAQAVDAVRSFLRDLSVPFGSAPSEAERAAVPTEGMPEGVSISSVVVPPADGIPAKLLEGRVFPAPVPAFWYNVAGRTQPPPPSTKVVLWIHGGNNIFNSPKDPRFVPKYLDLIKALGEEYVVFAPAYRLATVPENTFPVQLQDVFSVYVYLLREGYNPENITLGGESSGANSAHVLPTILAMADAPQPSRLVSFCPHSDATITFSDFARAQGDGDPLPEQLVRDATDQWLGLGERYASLAGSAGSALAPSKWERTDPLVSAAEIKQFPPGYPKTLIICGTADKLIDASHAIARNMEAAGVPVEYVEVEDMIHGFHIMPIFPTQSTEAWKKVVEFIKS